MGGLSTIAAHAATVFTAIGPLNITLDSFLSPDTYAGGYELRVILTELTLSSTLFDLHRVPLPGTIGEGWLSQTLTFETDHTHL